MSCQATGIWPLNTEGLSLRLGLSRHESLQAVCVIMFRAAFAMFVCGCPGLLFFTENLPSNAPAIGQEIECVKQEHALRSSKRCTHVDDVSERFRLICWSQCLKHTGPFEEFFQGFSLASGRLAAASLLQRMNGAAVFAARVCRSSRVSTSRPA